MVVKMAQRERRICPWQQYLPTAETWNFKLSHFHCWKSSSWVPVPISSALLSTRANHITWLQPFPSMPSFFAKIRTVVFHKAPLWLPNTPNRALRTSSDLQFWGLSCTQISSSRHARHAEATQAFNYIHCQNSVLTTSSYCCQTRALVLSTIRLKSCYYHRSLLQVIFYSSFQTR